MENEKQSKTAFAALLYRQSGVKPFEAALSLFPDTGIALRVSQEWPRDEFVLTEIARFAGEDSEYENRLPNKADLAREIWGILTSRFVEPDDKIKAAKLYAEINGFVVKPDSAPVGNGIAPPSVMEVPVYESDAAWEAAMASQQQRLQDDGMKEIKASIVHEQ